LDRRPDWGAETRNLTRLALEPLTDESMRRMLEGFVPGLPEAAIRAILAQADGIPLYAVETVRSLVADGRLELDGSTYRPVGELGELAVPDSLRSLIASRLDGLDPADRSLVADASVLGQAFGLPGLTAVSGHDAATLEPRLKMLVRRELFDVEIDPRSPERGQYRFVQSLIREVAYGTLARRERRTRHLAAARHFEALGDDELAGALASHYVAAYEASADGPEADAVAIQARLALSGGADRAATLGAHDQAVAYLRQAIAITADPAERAALHIRAATSANTAARHDDAMALARAGLDIARTLDDPHIVGAGEALLGDILIDAGQPAEAAEVLKVAVGSLPEHAPPEVRATILAGLSRALMRTGDGVGSVEAADLALDLAEHLGLDLLIAETLNNKGSSLGYLGRQREAIALLAAAVDLARSGGYVKAEIRARLNLAISSDDVRRAVETVDRGLELSRRVGDRSMANWAASDRLYLIYLVAEGWEDALAEAETELTEVRARLITSPLDEIRSLSVQGLMRVARGDPTDATLADIEALAERTSDSFGPGSVHLLRGDRAFLRGDYPEASQEMLDAASDPNISDLGLVRALRVALWSRDAPNARELADRLDAHPSSSTSTVASRISARAGIAALDGRHDEAIAGYRDALARFRAVSRDFDVACTALDFVLLVGREDPSARAAAEEARAIFVRVGARPYLEHLEAAMARGAATDQARRPDGVMEGSGSPG
jgi:tetratricopeptide (TPR) repeat protein